MRRWLLLLVLACLGPAATARAQVPPPPPHVIVGMGENSPAIFDDARFAATGIRHVRLIVPYDLVRVGGAQLAQADEWLREARAAGAEPLVSFGFSARRKRQFHLPSVAEYGARVAEFRERYPWVREFTTWNEANHKYVQPTGRHPLRTAAYYRELRRQCLVAGCRVVAVDVLLSGQRGTWPWIRAFRRAAGPGPHTWGIHNYPDVNRLTSRRTREFLRRVPGGEVWITETGGVVRFAKRWRHDERRAGRAVRHVFRLASISPRIARVYLYNWRQVRTNRRWDSGMLTWDGRPRHSYYSLLDALADDRFRPPPPEIVEDELPTGSLPPGDPGGRDD